MVGGWCDVKKTTARKGECKVLPRVQLIQWPAPLKDFNLMSGFGHAHHTPEPLRGVATSSLKLKQAQVRCGPFLRGLDGVVVVVCTQTARKANRKPFKGAAHAMSCTL